MSNMVLPAGRMTCATMNNNSLLNSSNGGIFALSLAAENALGMSVYTSTSVVVSLFEGQSVAKNYHNYCCSCRCDTACKQHVFLRTQNANSYVRMCMN